MKPRVEWNSKQATVGWIVGVAALGIILILIGLGPILGWRRSATSLVENRAGERAVLLALAFARDMRGVQETILAQTTPGDTVTLASDFTDLVAGAFARYPYAESFFVSGATPNPADITFFNRTARPPAWMHDEGTSFPFPVVVVTNPPVGQQIAERIRLDAINGRRFSVFDVRIGETPYQIVGSGFCVHERGVIISCRHVFEGFMEKSIGDQLAAIPEEEKSKPIKRVPAGRVIQPFAVFHFAAAGRERLLVAKLCGQ